MFYQGSSLVKGLLNIIDNKSSHFLYTYINLLGWEGQNTMTYFVTFQTITQDTIKTSLNIQLGELYMGPTGEKIGIKKKKVPEMLLLRVKEPKGAVP